MEVSAVSALQRAIIGGPGSMKWYFLAARSLVPLSWWIAQSTVWSVASGANLRSKVPESSRTRTVVPSVGLAHLRHFRDVYGVREPEHDELQHIRGQINEEHRADARRVRRRQLQVLFLQRERFRLALDVDDPATLVLTGRHLDDGRQAVETAVPTVVQTGYDME